MSAREVFKDDPRADNSVQFHQDAQKKAMTAR